MLTTIKDESVDTSKADMKIKKSSGEVVWKNENPALQIINSVDVVIPSDLQEVMLQIQYDLPDSSVEFALYLKGKVVDGILMLENKWMLPEQEVTAATIDFKEEAPAGFNGVIHRHPSGCTKFSGTDDEYINVNHEFSLLFVNRIIHSGIININSPVGRIQLPLDINIINTKKFDLDLEKVSKKVYQQKAVVHAGHYNYNSHGQVKHQTGMVGNREDFLGMNIPIVDPADMLRERLEQAMESMEDGSACLQDYVLLMDHDIISQEEAVNSAGIQHGADDDDDTEILTLL